MSSVRGTVSLGMLTLVAKAQIETEFSQSRLLSGSCCCLTAATRKSFSLSLQKVLHLHASLWASCRHWSWSEPGYAFKSLTKQETSLMVTGGVVRVTCGANPQARGSTRTFGVCFCPGCPWASNLPRIQRGIRHV